MNLKKKVLVLLPSFPCKSLYPAIVGALLTTAGLVLFNRPQFIF